MSDRGSREAFVTLATNDTYSLGCLVLGSSLRRSGTTRRLVVMVSKDVSLAMRSQLLGVFDFVQDVDILDSRDPVNLSLLGRPDLNVTFTKFHCWRLTQFDKCVFLDADTLVLQNVDELFDREELSAAPDAGWPDCFNSGVFVFKPSQETYESLLSFATSKGSFDGGDQGLLNSYYSDWASKDISKHLPFIYNVVSQAFYSYLPAFTQFKDTVKIVHFIGAVKPWHHTYSTSTRTVTPLPGTGHSQEFLQIWWDIFMSMVQPKLDPSLNVAEITQTLLSDSTWDIDESPDRVPKETPRFNKSYPTKTSIQTVYPYKLPEDVEVFYDNTEDIPTDNPGDSNPAKDIVDLPVLPREYTKLESHYAEEPISQINPDHPPGSVYDVKKVCEGWEKGNAPLKETVEQSDKSNEAKTDIPPEPPAIHETEDSNKATQSEKDEMGLCGDLAALKVQEQSSAGKIDLSDAERKLNWEKGQIDYLGQDSFDNIQKKIQSSLESEKAEAPPTNSSPFTPVPAPEVAKAPVKPAVKVVSKPAEPSKPAVKVATQSVAKAPSQPVAKAPTQPAAKAPTQPVAKAPTQPAAKAPSQPAVKAPSQPAAKAPTQPAAEAPSKPAAQAPSKPAAKAPSQPAAKAPSQPAAKAPTQPAAQAPSQTAAQAPKKSSMSITTTSTKKK